MPSILGVSQINRYLSLKIGSDVKLRGVTVRGELSDFKIHYKSGHAYFTLKDETSQLKGVMFSSSVSRLGFEPKSGMSVLCSGNIEVYEAGGVYQIKATEMIPEGIGAKFMRLNAIKEKLEKQGVFAQERKKPLPVLPKRIAIVTSLSGAALQDVLNILKRRYPVGEAVIYPAQVQGEAAHISIAAALKSADMSGSDVIILTRGGGSFEDLAPFNTEEIAVAISDCQTPVISAVGHETDTTLADYAADKRAPTPSAAAEICAPELDALKNTADIMKDRLDAAFEAAVGEREKQLERLALRLKAASPSAAVTASCSKLDDLGARLLAAMQNSLRSAHAKTDKLTASLEALSPYRVLERGYTLTLKDGTAVTQASQLAENDEVVIRFRDNAVRAKIIGPADI